MSYLIKNSICKKQNNNRQRSLLIYIKSRIEDICLFTGIRKKKDKQFLKKKSNMAEKERRESNPATYISRKLYSN